MSCSPSRTRRLLRCLGGALVGGCALMTAGCEAFRGAQIDHPVLGPPPPRLSSVETGNPLMTADASDSSEEEPGYVQVSMTESPGIPDHAVVATVNGEPILAGEILAGFQGHLRNARAQGATESDIAQIKKMAIEKNLDQLIDQTLLAQELRLQLDSEQLEQMEPKLDEAFDAFVQTLMEKQGIPSEVELEQFLAAKGESLAAYEQHFKTQQLAQLYLFEQVGSQRKVFGRPEILQFYRDHQEDFSHSARAQFQLLEVSFQKHGGRDEAHVRLNEALTALQAGTPFPTVAEQYSDDAQAEQGGQWDWLKPGEFANNEVDEAIFSQPIGAVGDPIETDSSFLVIRVTDREEAGLTPLADVQEKIRQLLQQQHQDQAREQLFAKLREQAVITRHLESGEREEGKIGK